MLATKSQFWVGLLQGPKRMLYVWFEGDSRVHGMIKAYENRDVTLYSGEAKLKKKKQKRGVGE